MWLGPRLVQVSIFQFSIFQFSNSWTFQFSIFQFFNFSNIEKLKIETWKARAKKSWPGPHPKVTGPAPLKWRGPHPKVTWPAPWSSCIFSIFDFSIFQFSRNWKIEKLKLETRSLCPEGFQILSGTFNFQFFNSSIFQIFDFQFFNFFNFSIFQFSFVSIVQFSIFQFFNFSIFNYWKQMKPRAT